LSTAGENTANTVRYGVNPTKEDEMAVVSIMRMQGDPAELASKLREHLRPVGRELAPTHGGLGNIVARTDDGVMVINLWENEEGRHAMAEEPKIQEALRAGGFPQPAFEGYEILDMVIRPEAVQEED
jgi:hypothetical protein